jgi:hypothetical protein
MLLESDTGLAAVAGARLSITLHRPVAARRSSSQCGTFGTAMKKTAKAPGEKVVKALIEKHGCPVPFHDVRTRFLGHIATPELSASPLQMIQDLWGGERATPTAVRCVARVPADGPRNLAADTPISTEDSCSCCCPRMLAVRVQSPRCDCQRAWGFPGTAGCDQQNSDQSLHALRRPLGNCCCGLPLAPCR